MTSKLHAFRLSLLGNDISLVQSAKDLGVNGNGGNSSYRGPPRGLLPSI